MNVKHEPLADLFHEFSQRIALSNSERVNLSHHAEEVTAKIAELLAVEETLPTGSFARSTAVHKFSDIDVMVILRQSTAAPQVEPKRLILPLIVKMQGSWTNVQASQNAVHVSFADGLCVDVLLAFRRVERDRNDVAYQVPSGDLRDWQPYVPGELDKRVGELDRKLGKSFKELIRIVKWWNGINGRPVASYEIEMLACETFKQGIPSIDVAIVQLFGEMARNAKSGSRIELLGGTAESLARQAVAAASRGFMVESVRYWRCLLGGQFPDIAS